MPPKKRPQHRVIVLAATKGGVGKTTIASAIAARAAADGARVALLDTDPQASLARWHELRGLPDNPKILDVDASSEALALVKSEKWDYLVIDTPPALLDRIQAAIYIADVVLIPVRPSALDIEAVTDVVSICRDFGKPFAFLINQVPDSGFVRMVRGAREYLSQAGGPVLHAQIGFRKSYVTAMTLGKTGPETGDVTARAEIDHLWGELQALAGVPHER